jgi:drug/metabolite transporter (DMT)-like permease
LSPTAIALILVAALAHASWNLFSKQAAAAGGALFAWLLAAAATTCYTPVIVIIVLVTRPHLHLLNWVFLVGTGVLQTGYFLFLQRGYRLGDLSVVYPVGRGTGALLAALAGIALLGERPGTLSLIGIGCIIIGIVLIGLPGTGTGQPDSEATDSRPSTGPAIGFALATGAFIAGYTLWDKYAVSTLRTPPLLQGFAAFPVMVALLAPFALADRQRTAEVWRQYRRQVVAAGLLAPLAYALVLVALSFTAVSVVAPAREVSVLFGVLLGRRMLGEPDLARKLAAAALIVAGIITVAIG